MSELKIINRSIDELKPSPGNPRTHSKQQIREIERSIKEFGFLNSVLIDGDDRILAGHGRVQAARNLGMTQVPTVCVAHLTPAQARAYMLADNRIALNAGWNLDLLSAEIRELSFNLDYDPTLTGFPTAEIDLMLKPKGSKLDAPEPEAPGVIGADSSKPPVSRPGDLWRIGDHKVLCGDSTDPESFRALMGNETAGIVFSDAPYNVRVDGHIGGRGQVTHAEFAMASGEMTQAEFTAFLKTVFQNMADFSRDGSVHYLCMDWRHMMEIMVASQGIYSELKNLCVWAKKNGGMGSFYRSRHELVFVYKKGTGPHINNVELGKHGRNRTNVWEYPGANAFGKTRDTDLAMHPTVKPVQLVADAIYDASNRGDIVLDAFAGSGSTLVAAEQTGRRGRGIEIEPRFVDTIVRRLEAETKSQATLVRTGETFATLQTWYHGGFE
jgi:DNA modification methylase